VSVTKFQAPWKATGMSSVPPSRRMM
jgi:hypothetical protein